MNIQIKNRKIEADYCRGAMNLIGFMFNFSQKKAKILCFNNERKVSLHMFFVFSPLLAIFVNSEHKIVDMRSLRPFEVYTSKTRAKYVLEVPQKLGRVNAKIGDKIKFIG